MPAEHFNDNAETFYDQMLQEICAAEKIDLVWLSRGWLGVLTKGTEQNLIMGHKFNLNAAVASLIADDKFATFEMLERAKIPVAEHQIIYPTNNTRNYAKGYNSLKYAEEYLAKQGKIVVKPNTGTQGQGVSLVQNAKELAPALSRAFGISYSASLCPFYEIKFEYRVIMLDGQARLIYCKTRAKDWRFNLEHGAKATKVQDENLRARLSSLAQKVVAAIGLRFCSVDLIETVAGELLVLEVNSGVMTEHYLEQNPTDYDLVRQIYHDAVRKMFSLPGQAPWRVCALKFGHLVLNLGHGAQP